jgi:hypothetical protein
MKISPSLKLAFFLPVFLIGGYTVDYATAAQEAPVMLDQVLSHPQQYLDRDITVMGVLVAAGKGFPRRFFLQDQAGRTLEVTPWAPLEVFHPPPSRPQPPAVKPMSYFVGRRLRLTGRLKQQGENFVLQVSAAEEL